MWEYSNRSENNSLIDFGKPHKKGAFASCIIKSLPVFPGPNVYNQILLLLQAFATTSTPALPMPSACSVTRSRRLLLKQNDNISPLLHYICKPLPRHALSLKGAAGILWVIEAGRQEGRFKGCTFCFVLIGAVTSLCLRENSRVPSEQNNFANYFTPVRLGGTVGKIERITFSGEQL